MEETVKLAVLQVAAVVEDPEDQLFYNQKMLHLLRVAYQLLVVLEELVTKLVVMEEKEDGE